MWVEERMENEKTGRVGIDNFLENVVDVHRVKLCRNWRGAWEG